MGTAARSMLVVAAWRGARAVSRAVLRAVSRTDLVVGKVLVIVVGELYGVVAERAHDRDRAAEHRRTGKSARRAWLSEVRSAL